MTSQSERERERERERESALVQLAVKTASVLLIAPNIATNL
jgi:hypothetical protein